MAGTSTTSLVKEVVIVDGLPTVVSKILPKKLNNKYVIVVIPGNPGLVEFYDDFVTTLFNSLHGQSPVYAISHAGHSSAEDYSANPDQNSLPVDDNETKEANSLPLSLKEQIAHKNKFLEGHISTHSRIILIGHSIGAYVILNLLRTCQRASDITKAFLLFPTVERMAISPSGRYVTPLVTYFKWLAIASSAAFSILPAFVKEFLVRWWLNDRKRLSLSSVESILKLLTPQSIDGVFTMAQHEMKEVVDLDDQVIEQNLKKLLFYYGATDHWTPISYYEDMKEKFPDGEIYLCERKFKHAFVLESSEEVAEMVASWIQERIYPRVSNKPLPNDAKGPLPVDVRRSTTLLLKLPGSVKTRQGMLKWK